MHVELDTSFLRPLFGSARCWIRRSLDMIWTYSFLNRMFLYVSFVLDPPLSLASPLPFAFAIGLRLLPLFRPCAHCRASIYHLFSLAFLITGHLLAYDTARLVAGRTQFPFPSPFLTRSFYRVAYIVSRYPGLELYISKPSPGERQATVAHLPLFLFPCVLGNCGPFLSSSHDSFSTDLSRSYRP